MRLQDGVHREVVNLHLLMLLQFGQVRGTLLQQGISVPTVDLMIASAALVYNLTLVTHNTTEFSRVPGLALEDWQ